MMKKKYRIPKRSAHLALDPEFKKQVDSLKRKIEAELDKEITFQDFIDILMNHYKSVELKC